jgi:iron complex outermembrane receptor protein
MSHFKSEPLAAALLAALSSTALAQETTSQDTVGLPAIEVGTGGAAGYSAPPILQNMTKIDVPLFNLPVVVNTVPEQAIVDQNAIVIQDALQNVSGVRSNSNNLEGYVYNIRGFTSFNVFRNGLLVGVAIPQVYDTSNLQSLEVLKGPASFLFGRADPGGVINRITKKPLGAPYYSLTQEFGSFNLWRTVWDLTGPVQVPALDNGAVAYRFSGAYTKGGQFVDFTNNENIFLAPAVAWRIGPNTLFTVEAEYTHQNAQSNVGQPAISFDPQLNLDPFSVLRPNLYPANIPVYRSFGEPNQPPDRVRSALISYHFEHNLDNNWKITNRFLAARGTLEKFNLTALGFFDPDNPFVLDRSITYQKLTGTNYSANLDLTGAFHVLGARNDILIGADYFYQFYNYVLASNGTYPIDIFNPIYGTVPTFDFYNGPDLAWSGTADGFSQFSSNENRGLGIYAQDSISLFDDTLHVLLGARYDLADARVGRDSSQFIFDEETGEFSIIQPTFGQASANFAAAPFQHTQRLSPRIGFVYQPVPWLGFYGSYTQSFGQQNGISNNNRPLPPELATGWEGGVKAELLDRRLLATLAFFNITKSNILTPSDPLNPFSELRPIGLARSTGVEIDLLGKLTDELSIIASYSHIAAYVIQDIGSVPDPENPDIIIPGLLGNALGSYAPDSGSVWLTYTFPPGSGLEGWTAGGGVFAASNRWGDNTNIFILPAYARLDAFARYQFVAGGAKWSAQLNLKNIADTRYYEGNDVFFNNAFGNERFGVFPGAPRAITASLRVEF